MKHCCLLLAAVSCCLGLRAQSDLSANLLRGTWQAAQTNPALLLPDGGNLLIGLGGFYNNSLVTNVTYNDLIGTDADGRTVLNVDDAINLLDDDGNVLRQNLDFETIGVGFRLGSVALSVGHRLRFNAFLEYTKALPQLIWQGNAQFIGQTVGISPEIDLIGYHEISAGATLPLSEAITVGGRVKLLSGIGNVMTERADMSLTTDEEYYELTLDGELRVNTAAAVRYEGFRELGVDFNFGQFETGNLFSGNAGLAFDLGVAIDLGRLQLNASVLDLGGNINWDEDVNNYTLTGPLEYRGLDVAESILEDSTSFGGIIDTLEAIYGPMETQQAYSTSIGTKFYAGGNFSLTDAFQVGAVILAEDFRDELRTDVALTAAYQLSPLLRIGGLYGVRNGTFDNIGLNLLLSVGPVRILAATDNIITAFRPKDSHQSNVRLGVNLVFGGERRSSQSYF